MATLLYLAVALLAPVLHAKEDVSALRAFLVAVEQSAPGDEAPGFPGEHHELECLLCHSAGVPPALVDAPRIVTPPAAPEIRALAAEPILRSSPGLPNPARAPPFV